jgi:ABC-type multidrug transport system fused ATPase/permease subunit
VDEEDRISGIIVDNIINFETVKIFSKEAWEQKRLKNAFKVWMKKLWGYSHSFRVLDISVGTIVNLSIYLILLFTLNRSVGGNFSVGDFVLVLGFVNNFFPRLFDLVWGFRDIAKHYADIEKYFGILDYDVKVKDPKNPVELTRIKGEIVYDNVGFSYEGGTKDAVKDIDLTIRQGQSIALVGRSGSGKTTLVKLLMRFFDLEEGKITIDEVDIKNMKKADLRSFIGLVPQEPVLFNNTVGYNIGYGKGRASKKEIRAAAKIANLDGFIETLPKKYKTHVGERGIKLSGGQKQRLAIARMVLSDPDIVIFDEATSQLDSENEALIQDAFWRAVKDKTTIIIAHRLSTAMRADKIVVMEKGKIVEKGSHKELVSNKDGLYKYFWDLQVNVD